MADLPLAVNGEYFDAMKRGEKTEEYRLVNAWWGRRLFGRDYERRIITRGYPRKDDASRRLVTPYDEYEIKSITHKHFGSDLVKVFAVKN